MARINSIKGLRRSVGSTALVAAIAAVSPALAQGVRSSSADGGTGADEIVVTARSQGETLLEVPVAVTAMGEAQLAKFAASDLSKIAQMAPELEIYPGGAGAGGAFLIRGIGTTADTTGVDPSVSLAIDGTQIARPRTSYAGMFDLEQVAILKGPQALFFGRNASAGVVSIQTANPTGDLSGYVRGGYEFEARERYVEAAVSIPITETLGVRFAGRYSKLRGWVRNNALPFAVDPFNPVPGNTIGLPGATWRWGPGSENKGGRITLKWSPSSAYTSVMKAMFLGYSDVSGTSVAEPICDGVPTNFGFPDQTSDCKLNGQTSQTSLPPEYAKSPYGDRRFFNGEPYSEMNSMLLTWQQTLDLGRVTIQANTGYTKHKFGLRGNYSGMEYADWHGGIDEDFKGFSQEARFISQFDGPFNFTVGAYYEDTRNTKTTNLFLFNAGPDPDTGSYQAAFGEAYDKGKVWSAFAQARFDISPQVELAGGVRYTKTKKRVLQGQFNYVHQHYDPNFTPPSATGGFLLPEGVGLTSRIKEDNWSPEATITWHPTPDSTLYAAAKTGYKSGGIAQPAILSLADTSSSVIFNPEKAKGGEIGYKAQLLDRRLRFEATVYFYRFSGLQLTSYDPVAVSYRVQNAADADQKGIELSASYRVMDGLTLNGALSYNSVKYKKFTDASCYANQLAGPNAFDLPGDGLDGLCDVQDLSGRRLHRAPKWNATFGVSYETEVGNSLKFGFDGSVRYSSSYFASEQLAPNSKQNSYALLNAAARIGSEDDTWELALIGRNLTNKRIIGFVQDKSGAFVPGKNEIYAYGSRPREVAVQATFRF